jgi:hypothetical protein
MLQEIEAAIERHLATLLPKQQFRSKVRAFPEDLKELHRPVPQGSVLVGYKRSSYSVIEDSPLIVEELALFDITIYIKGLRTHQGAYPLLDEICFLLMGWQSGCHQQVRPAYVSDRRFLDVDTEQIWSYSITLTIPLKVIAGQRFEFTPLNPEGEPDIWADFDNLTINIGLWRSPVERLGEIPVSTKDKELQVAIDISEN